MTYLFSNAFASEVIEIYQENKNMKLEKIKNHWENSGRNFPCDGQITPTSRDPYLGELERDNILAYLDMEYTCLEIGCGDAFHTMHYAKRVKHMLAIDVANSLINIASQRAQLESLRNVELCVDSVLNIIDRFESEQFDCVLSQRCLINLPDWELQKNAIIQIHHLLTDKGILLLSEGFQDHLNNLNELRTTLALPEIQVVDYNRNFFLDEFEDFVQRYFEVIEIRHYGAYLFFTRVYHPLVALPESPSHNSKMNKVAMDISKVETIPNLEKYSYNLFYVLKKRGYSEN